MPSYFFRVVFRDERLGAASSIDDIDLLVCLESDTRFSAVASSSVSVVSLGGTLGSVLTTSSDCSTVASPCISTEDSIRVSSSLK